MIAKRSPAGPTFIGSIRVNAAAVATAASMALPPFLSTSRPACAASGWLVVTMPLRAITSERCCATHPCERSPGTALQNAGFGVELHDCTGDWAISRDALPAMAASNRHLDIARRHGCD